MKAPKLRMIKPKMQEVMSNDSFDTYYVLTFKGWCFADEGHDKLYRITYDCVNNRWTYKDKNNRNVVFSDNERETIQRYMKKHMKKCHSFAITQV